MPGTVAGGKLAAKKNLANDPNFYKRIGKIGGANGNTGGWASRTTCDGTCGLNHLFGIGHTKPQCCGYRGGLISRRKITIKEN